MPGESDQFGFVVRNITADFLGSATLGDILEIKSFLKTKKHTSIILTQSIWHRTQKLFEMEVRLVYMERGKIVRIPSHFLKIFKELF